MTRTNLDEALDGMATSLSGSVVSEAERIADETMPKRLSAGRKVRGRWLLPACVAGGVLLTAGASTGVIAMSHWAGVSMPLGNVRNTAPIPVTWVTEDGHAENCRAWIEVRNPHRGDDATLDDAIVSHNWTGLGQHLYDTEPPREGDSDGESRVALGLEPILRAFVQQTFDDIHWLSEGHRAGPLPDSDARTVDAMGMICGAAG
ncbi:hypothetical protein ACLD0U_14410 [Microbacterium sp. 2216-1]|uniref:hypothetical protein n=1 Tax=Microbacterium sp. 2216-1 TaxID=3390053 RepID=UPI003975F695